MLAYISASKAYHYKYGTLSPSLPPSLISHPLSLSHPSLPLSLSLSALNLHTSPLPSLTLPLSLLSHCPHSLVSSTLSSPPALFATSCTITFHFLPSISLSPASPQIKERR